MKITLDDGLVVRIKWHHEHVNGDTPIASSDTSNTKYRGVTTCWLTLEPPPHYGLYASAIHIEKRAECSMRDRFCKEIGRKVSLTKALSGMDKAIRRQIWNGYLNRTDAQLATVQ